MNPATAQESRISFSLTDTWLHYLLWAIPIVTWILLLLILSSPNASELAASKADGQAEIIAGHLIVNQEHLVVNQEHLVVNQEHLVVNQKQLVVNQN